MCMHKCIQDFRAMLCSSPLAYCGERCEEMGCIRGGEGMAGEGTDVLRWGKRRGGGGGWIVDRKAIEVYQQVLFFTFLLPTRECSLYCTVCALYSRLRISTKGLARRWRFQTMAGSCSPLATASFVYGITRWDWISITRWDLVWPTLSVLSPYQWVDRTIGFYWPDNP